MAKRILPKLGLMCELIDEIRELRIEGTAASASLECSLELLKKSEGTDYNT